MSLNQKIEENADTLLWCVHVLGPDDIYAAPNHSAAATHAYELNNAVHSRMNAKNDLLFFAYARPWDKSRYSHQEAVKEWLK